MAARLTDQEKLDRALIAAVKKLSRKKDVDALTVQAEVVSKGFDVSIQKVSRNLGRLGNIKSVPVKRAWDAKDRKYVYWTSIVA